MKQRWIVIALIVSTALNLVFLGIVARRIWERRQRPSRSFERISRFEWKGREGEFHFKPGDEMRLHSHRKLFKPRMEGIQKDLREARRELGDLILEEKPDTSAIDRHVEKIGSLQTRIEKEVVRQLLREKAALDPERRERYLQFIIQRMVEQCRPTPGFPGGSRRHVKIIRKDTCGVEEIEIQTQSKEE
ncbi:periplasmic heavy metal sensor [bacterium]|nr:periplasmic heavy metal sensor [bacterium]